MGDDSVADFQARLHFQYQLSISVYDFGLVAGDVDDGVAGAVSRADVKRSVVVMRIGCVGSVGGPPRESEVRVAGAFQIVSDEALFVEEGEGFASFVLVENRRCLLYTSPSPRDRG